MRGKKKKRIVNYKLFDTLSNPVYRSTRNIRDRVIRVLSLSEPVVVSFLRLKLFLLYILFLSIFEFLKSLTTQL